MTFLEWCRRQGARSADWQGTEVHRFCLDFSLSLRRPRAPKSLRGGGRWTDAQLAGYLDAIQRWAAAAGRGHDATVVRQAWDAWQKAIAW